MSTDSLFFVFVSQLYSQQRHLENFYALFNCVFNVTMYFRFLETLGLKISTDRENLPKEISPTIARIVDLLKTLNYA